MLEVAARVKYGWGIRTGISLRNIQMESESVSLMNATDQVQSDSGTEEEAVG